MHTHTRAYAHMSSRSHASPLSCLQKNEIDLDALLLMTDKDYKEMGLEEVRSRDIHVTEWAVNVSCSS